MNPDEEKPETAEQPYQPTLSDQALMVHLYVTELGGTILQARIDGLISLELYKKLYDGYEKVNVAIAILEKRLGKEK